MANAVRNNRASQNVHHHLYETAVRRVLQRAAASVPNDFVSTLFVVWLRRLACRSEESC